MKKILCFRNSKLGDYLISIPALKLIRKKYPNCKIYYLLAENKQRPYLPKKIEKEIIVDKFIYFKHDLTSWIKTTNILYTSYCNYNHIITIITKIINFFLPSL